MLQSLGYDALVGLFSHIIFIMITWKAIQSVRVDEYFKKGKSFEIRLLYVLVTIAIGTTVSNFFLDVLEWSQDLVYFFY